PPARSDWSPGCARSRASRAARRRGPPRREPASSIGHASSLASFHLLLAWVVRAARPAVSSDVDRFSIGGLPAPGARAIAALHHPLLVDRRDDLAVAGQKRFGRAHFGAERQLAF